jgi:hypothetical protein
MMVLCLLVKPGMNCSQSYSDYSLRIYTARFYQKDPDVAVSCETMPGPSKQSTQGAKGICNPIGGTTVCSYVCVYTVPYI